MRAARFQGGPSGAPGRLTAQGPPLCRGTGRRLLFCAAMQIHRPDPAYTGSERSRANFRLAAKITLGFVALIWAIALLNWMLDLGPDDFGIRPRELAGLPGILFAPLVHGG